MPLDHAQVTSRMLVLLVLIVGLIALVGVIITGVALNSPSQPQISISQSANSFSSDILNDWLEGGFLSHGATDGWQLGPDKTNARAKREVGQPLRFQPDILIGQKREWTLAIGPDQGLHSSIDENGVVSGFIMQLVNAVCSAINIKCHVMMDRYDNCWYSQSGNMAYGGQGLLGGWYDGCVGWAATAARRQVFNFTSPHADLANSHLFISTTSEPRDMLTDASKIGYVAGWASNDKCFSKIADKSSMKNAVSKETVTSLVDALGLEVDAVFLPYDAAVPFIKAGTLKKVGDDAVQCTEAGVSVMTRKDSIFTELWNRGLEAIRQNGQYDDLCRSAQQLSGLEERIIC